MKFKRTSTYVTSVSLNPSNLNAIMTIMTVRDTVKAINADLKWVGTAGTPRGDLRYRVCINGRLGKNNPNAAKYRRGGSLRPTRIRLEDAAYADIYVLPRYNYSR